MLVALVLGVGLARRLLGNGWRYVPGRWLRHLVLVGKAALAVAVAGWLWDVPLATMVAWSLDAAGTAAVLLWLVTGAH